MISAAKSEASSPPVPARISTKTFLSSFGSFGCSRMLDLFLQLRRLRLQLGDLHLRELAHVVVRLQHLPRVGEALCERPSARGTSRPRRRSRRSPSSCRGRQRRRWRRPDRPSSAEARRSVFRFRRVFRTWCNPAQKQKWEDAACAFPQWMCEASLGNCCLGFLHDVVHQRFLERGDRDSRAASRPALSW